MQAFKATYQEFGKDGKGTEISKMIGAGTFSGAAKKAEGQQVAGALELIRLETTNEVIL